MNAIQQMKEEIQQLQTRILELLHELPGGQFVESKEYQQLRTRLTELQNMVRRYEIEQVFGHYGYLLHYCRCPVPEISVSNRQHPARCLNCGRVVPEFLTERDESDFDYRREILTFVAFVLAVAALAYLFLTGGVLP